MKILFVLLTLLLLFNGNSVSAKRGISFKPAEKTSSISHKSDTLVGVHDIPKELTSPNYAEREYFLINQNDTSSFSCFLYEDVISKHLSLQFEYSPYSKTPTSYSPADTNVVSEQKNIQKAYKETSYEEQLQELRFILKFISKDYDISRIKKIKMSIRSFKELSLGITRKYIDQFGKKFNYKSNERIKKLIEESEFTADITKILAPYSIIIDEVSVLEFVYYSPQNDMVEGSVERRLPAKKQKRIIDGMLLLNLRAKAIN
ncbi:hypothetical protein [Pedobacter caeni]|uniref:DUF4294 domain-containing protein n=1 Tax=Pedobacter caeni TaxID=288992 RepID=A0A1M4V8H4_9SPHI|nr:hypothetical protein [Pedobacter caeni]SHE65265.1 hypothetical protein SAMN04488522_101817 [Pedobacter caeni]